MMIARAGEASPANRALKGTNGPKAGDVSLAPIDVEPRDGSRGHICYP